MKVLTLNFLTCAVKACKSSSESFPLHPKDAELVQDDIDINPQLLINVLPRIDWTALRTTATEVSFSVNSALRIHRGAEGQCFMLTNKSLQLGFNELPEQPPTADELQANEVMLTDLHHLLMETQIMEGKLVCAACGHEYAIREGIANFLLPGHLV
jgi:multifunctional methyltransferase subunit TRM112